QCDQLCKVPRFRGYQQQDAHEFLRYLLDRIHQESLDNCPVPEKRANMCFTGVEGTKSSIIGNIFGGILQNEVNCLKCGFISKSLDPFLDLSLDIPGQRVSSYDTTSSDSNSSYSGSNEDCHLMDCLSSFIELEELTETELYCCSNCQQKQRSTKRFWIRRLPDVLCLHLKRFRWNNYVRTKIDSYIEFPLQGLDMKRFVMANKHETRGSSLGPTVYDLSAFIEHHGTGVGSGHYTAYAYHEGIWFHFDDSSVTACEESMIRQTKPYILFYNRRSS
ncbi:Ubiquitin carboxyl-terminal hydrolase 3, partial [Fragariocoptes setiger]